MQMVTLNESNEVLLEGSVTANCIQFAVTQPSKKPEARGHSHSCTMRLGYSLVIYHNYMNNGNKLAVQYRERKRLLTKLKYSDRMF